LPRQVKDRVKVGKVEWGERGSFREMSTAARDDTKKQKSAETTFIFIYIYEQSPERRTKTIHRGTAMEQ